MSKLKSYCEMEQMSYTVYGKDNCANCDKAKMLLDMKSCQYEYVDIVKNIDKAEYLRNHGFRSVPQIFNNGHHIGGYEELKSLIC